MIKIRELSAQDSDELAAFFSTQSGASRQALRSRLEWLARNPAATSDIPSGVAAYRSGQMCGAMMYVPVRFSNGVEARTCVLSILFYVDSSARGAGLPLFIAFRSLAERYALYAATANNASARLWANFGGHAVAGSEFEYVRICRALPVVTEWVFRKFGRGHEQPSSSVWGAPLEYRRSERLVPIDDPESALRSIAQTGIGFANARSGDESSSQPLKPALSAGFGGAAPPQNAKVAGSGDPEAIPCAKPVYEINASSYSLLRDAALIRWKIYEAGQKLYAYRTRDSDCLCALQRSRRGSRSQISAAEILELWGRLEPRD